MKIVHAIKRALLKVKKELIPNIEEENNFFQDIGKNKNKNKHSIKVKKYKLIGGNLKWVLKRGLEWVLRLVYWLLV